MRVTLRLAGAIWLVTAVLIAVFGFLQVRAERERLLGDLERRATLLGEGVKEALEPAWPRASRQAVERLLRKFARPGQTLVVYDRVGGLIVASPDGSAPAVAFPEVTEALADGTAHMGVRGPGDRPVYVWAGALVRDERTAGAVALLLDASHLRQAEWTLWRDNAVRYLVFSSVLSLMAGLIVWVYIARPLGRMARWSKAVRRGRAMVPLEIGDRDLFGPIAREVSVLVKSLQRARAAAEEEAALRLTGQTRWTEERLKQFVKMRLGDAPLVVVSNREPVKHARRDGQIVAETPPSGLVTAMEPVMRACGGVWVAHGSGDADRETADEHGRLPVPPDDPRYVLRRVWLTPEEEAGYYYGFANEGLWPLCHIVHTRPQFRPEDWAHYRAVNEKFAASVLEEVADAESPMVLIQDYHFALLPALLKRDRPDARTAIFWHIPWPNAEAFSICPWQRELLGGMLGADLIGFHTQYYCNNFLETVERAIEARVDWEHFSVSRGQRVTYLKPFPISVAPDFVENPPRTSRRALLERLGVAAEFVGVGVERLDYTKGLPERFRALGRFLERYPAYRERLVFLQLAAPSRSTIPRYRDLEAEVEEVVRQVNAAFQTRHWRPILYLKGHHEHRDIWPFYRYADFCMVTSLHDGMNLVAKEFVSVQQDDDAALILSQFAGASSELRDAILVNPYDVDGVAEAIRLALEMAPEERRARMARMREEVREHNIYRWAGLLLNELVRIPEEALSGAEGAGRQEGEP